ncbi:SERPINE1 mRNA-binding protein 1-like [Anabrus simplex]|uniref:SERPINE1 mRNA-binding protein 1-like n=1 Tax=Anabrus simplex TaxID=316456 RepID=UPI0034DD004A
MGWSFPDSKEKVTRQSAVSVEDRTVFSSDELNGAESDGSEKRSKYRSFSRRIGRGRGSSRTKREFDRLSGSVKTGIKPVDKREGRGARNWGSPRDDIADFGSYPRGNQLDWVPDKADGDAPLVTECPQEPPILECPQDAAEKGTLQSMEEEVNVITLDEYYAKRGSRQKPTYNLRKAGEGEDLSHWKKMYALKKKTERSEDQDDEDDYNIWDFPQRAGRQKYLLDIDIQFSDARLGIRNRGRGGIRRPGRGWESDQRFDRGDVYLSQDHQQATPKVYDENDFPSL